MITRIGMLLLLMILLHGPVQAQVGLSIKDITVLKEPSGQMMRDYMIAIATKQFEARDSILSTLRSEDDWKRRASTIRDSLISWTGPFPERTPLNARITGRLEREGYVVEKILFESRPGFLVSANLYVPENYSFPCPAVLNVIGHYGGGKSTGLVQSRCIGQARKGFVAMAIDGIGQGERRLDDYIPVGGSGKAHKTIGKQAFIAGTHLFNLMVWDAIRAIDYLVERPEVDKDNICITGCSGGGMMSSLILPFEDRIKVSVPACYPNVHAPKYRNWVGTDSEKIFFGAFRCAIDPRGDPLLTHVPKPLMINATTDDSNSPRGVWELSTWLYKSYVAQGVPENFTTSMIRGPHGYNREQREAAYSWMMRWTGIKHNNYLEEDMPTENARDLWASTSGNVYHDPENRKPHDLILDYYRENRAEQKPVSSHHALDQHKVGMVKLITEVLSMDPEKSVANAEYLEPRVAGNLAIRPFVLEPEAGIILPGIILETDAKRRDKGVILYINVRSSLEDTYGNAAGIIPSIHESGKSGILEDMGLARKALEEGYRICAIDLRGLGETGPFNEESNWHFMCGELIFGQRLRDVLSTLKWLREEEAAGENIIIWGKGMGSLYGAFAGVFDESPAGFILEEPLLTFESLIEVTIPQYGTEIILPGILEHFDMAQVYQALCPRPVTLLNPRLGDKSDAGKTEIQVIDKPVSDTYRATGKRKGWIIRQARGDKREKIIKKILLH